MTRPGNSTIPGWFCSSVKSVRSARTLCVGFGTNTVPSGNRWARSRTADGVAPEVSAAKAGAFTSSTPATRRAKAVVAFRLRNSSATRMPAAKAPPAIIQRPVSACLRRASTAETSAGDMKLLKNCSGGLGWGGGDGIVRVPVRMSMRPFAWIVTARSWSPGVPAQSGLMM